jgi:hypothetical protein
VYVRSADTASIDGDINIFLLERLELELYNLSEAVLYVA